VEMTHPLPFPTPAAWLAKLVSSHDQEGHQKNELSGHWGLESSTVETGAVLVERISLKGGLKTRSASASPESLLLRLESPWQMTATNIRAGQIEIGEVHSAGRWNYPELNVTNVAAQIYGGYLRGSASLNVQMRVARARTESDFPYEKVARLLEEQVQRWFAQFEWDDPPHVESELAVRFPEWTSQWKTADLAKTLELAGRFEGGGKFRGIPADKAASHFSFSNFVWTLPDLTITRPEGQARLKYVGNVTNGDFACEMESRLDPGILKALVPKEHQAEAEVVKFTQPPLIVAKAAAQLCELPLQRLE